MMNIRLPVLLLCALTLGVSACSEVSVPDARNVKIPNPVAADERREAINERPDSVMYLPLGADVLVPEVIHGSALPTEIVGPFELRSETLGGALQLILADYDVSIAFETEEGLSRKVTVANLKGPLNQVVNRVCSLADLYCSFEEGGLVVKETQTFTVTLPPIGNIDGSTEFITDVIQGLTAVLGPGGSAPASDPTTRAIIYSATQRTSRLAENYFQRLRANTAMIVFETYIWEVSLDAGNSTGVDWQKIEDFGKFTASVDFSGSIAADFTNPVSIGLPTTQATSPTEFVEFLSQFGAVKTISQPQITVLSGARAELRVADTENYVSEVSSTVSGDNTTTSVSTNSVDSGFTLSIGSSWDKSTVYANVNVSLTNVDEIQDFAFDTDSGGGQTTIQLPQTTERELTTQIRVRPGDSVLIGGLVREGDNFNSRGPGFMEPILPDSRTAQTDNLELVILLRPRVIVYTSAGDDRYKKFKKQKLPEFVSNILEEADLESGEVPAYVAPTSEDAALGDVDVQPLRVSAPIDSPVVAMPEEVVVEAPVEYSPVYPSSDYQLPTSILPPAQGQDQNALPLSINEVPTPSVSLDNMMSAPALELVRNMEDVDSRVLGLTDQPLSAEQYNLQAIQHANQKIQAQITMTQQGVLPVQAQAEIPMMATLNDLDDGRYVNGFVSRHVALPNMINPRSRSLMKK